MLIRIWLVVVVTGLVATGAPVVDESFDTLTIGKDTFTNVTVLNKTRTDVFISHSKGMVSLKVKDLDTPAQLKLGYQIAPPKPTKAEAIKQTMAGITEMKEDPRVQAAEAEVFGRFSEALEQFDPRIFHGFIAAIILAYLSFSSLCRAICLKVASPPKDLIPLVWLPLLKQLPLLKAAGMSPWWMLTNLIPGLFLVTYVVWSFKITQARGKHVATAVFLLLPVTNLLAFLYLSMSGGAAEPAGDRRNIISLHTPQRREAA